MLQRDGACPWCVRTSYSRHFKQCNVVFQCALLGLLQEDVQQRGNSLRQLDASPGQQALRNTGPRGGDTEDKLGSGVSLLAALTLQQEDSLNRLRLDTSDTFHLQQSGQGAAPKALFLSGQAWRAKKEKGEPVPALRTVIFGLLLEETMARMKLFDQDAGAIKAAQDLQLISQDKLFLFQRWNQITQKLEPDQSKQGLKAEAALSALQELGKLCRDDVLTKSE